MGSGLSEASTYNNFHLLLYPYKMSLVNLLNNSVILKLPLIPSQCGVEAYKGK